MAPGQPACTPQPGPARVCGQRRPAQGAPAGSLRHRNSRRQRRTPARTRRRRGRVFSDIENDVRTSGAAARCQLPAQRLPVDCRVRACPRADDGNPQRVSPVYPTALLHAPRLQALPMPRTCPRDGSRHRHRWHREWHGCGSTLYAQGIRCRAHVCCRGCRCRRSSSTGYVAASCHRCWPCSSTAVTPRPGSRPTAVDNAARSSGARPARHCSPEHRSVHRRSRWDGYRSAQGR